MRRLRAALLLLPLVGFAHPVVAAAPPAASEEWKTPAEATGFRETPSYADTIAWIRKAEAANPRRIQLGFAGESGEGRPIPYVVIDREGKFDPISVRSTDRVVVLIQSGIHSGEIDGKDASLMLLRDLALNHRLSGILTKVTVVLLPIYNVDGHEKRSPYNRVNQNGPKEMGFRTNANGLDLNRDYLKADSAEARAFAKLFSDWRPDFFVDCHVTNGADYRYDVTYAWQPSLPMPKPIGQWMDGNFQRVLAGLEEKGHLTAPYIWLKEETDPTLGMTGGAAPPRFSTGYTPLRNRPGLLVETHVYKDYATRVKATFDLLESLLLVLHQQADPLRKAVLYMDNQKVEWGKRYDPAHKIGLRWGLSEEPERFTFKTWKMNVVRSEVTGGKFAIYGREPLDLVIPYWSTPKVEVEVPRPTGYLIPPSRRDVVARLETHGLKVVRLDRPVTGSWEMYRVSDPKWRETSYQGRHPLESSTVVPVVEERTFPAGSFFVPLAHPDADVAIHLLEPQGPDSLYGWGFFDSVFERKEYVETAVIERLIAKMISEDPSLIEQLAADREKDPSLAASADRMRDWFYRRSPYWDRDFGLYPVARVTTQAIPLPKEPAAK